MAVNPFKTIKFVPGKALFTCIMTAEAESFSLIKAGSFARWFRCSTTV